MKLSQSSNALKGQQGPRKGRGKLMPVGRPRFGRKLGNRPHWQPGPYGPDAFRTRRGFRAVGTLSTNRAGAPIHAGQAPSICGNVPLLGRKRKAAKSLGISETTGTTYTRAVQAARRSVLTSSTEVGILEYDPFEGRSVLVHFNSGESPQLKKNIRSEKETPRPGCVQPNA